MKSRIYNGEFIKYPQILLKLKLWLLEDLIPLLCLTEITFLLAAPFIQPILIVYTCYKWKLSFVFWLAYFTWTVYDAGTLNAGHRKIESLKNSSALSNLRRYFPLRLVKLTDLTPDKNYVLGCFPHGVLPYGCAANLSTNANKVAELFPDIDIRIVTLSLIFRFPLTREFFMALGFCTANEKNLLCLLNSKPSKAVAIFPDGNKGVSLSHSGKVYTIVKNDRKGFVKVALETGSSLVPVFSFGEQNTLDQEPLQLPILAPLMKFLHKVTKVEPVLIKSRGYNFALLSAIILPNRCPITTVVGEPIEVPKVKNPSAELIDEYHEKFHKALYELFEKYKHEYDEAGEEAQLVVV